MSTEPVAVSVGVTVNGQTHVHELTAGEAVSLAAAISGHARRLSGGVTTDATHAAIAAFFALSHDINPESAEWYRKD